MNKKLILTITNPIYAIGFRSECFYRERKLLNAFEINNTS